MDLDIVDNKLILRLVAGTATDLEKRAVLDWIEANDKNREEFIRIKNSYVHKQLLSLDRSQKRKIFINTALKYAAILFLLIAITGGGFLAFNSFKEPIVHKQAMASFKYIVNTGVKGVVELPDGSKVWLNSASYIVCPQKFSDKVREIELEGEGYFEVVPNKEWPMLVKTSKDYTVKVTGTTFNLSSYNDDDKLVITLISGEVSLINNKRKRNNEIKMVPNQELTILSEKSKLKENANTVKSTAWKDGLLLFDNTPMREVIKKIERWYGVNIIVKDSKIYDYRFTAKFKSESVSQVLEILKLSSNINSHIEDTTITLLGS